MRIDKFLWSVRLFKTRSLATVAVRDGKVTIDGDAVKASRDIKVGEEVAIRRGAVTFQVKIRAVPKGRVGAKLVDDYIEDVTSEEELEKLEMLRIERRLQPKTRGRPTKRSRREWRKWMG